ncbi:MAG: small multi-drug export protein [Methanomicrobiales archaeon]|nr:small multi-drug export protein [Methanomicrobiales archaeon]
MGLLVSLFRIVLPFFIGLIYLVLIHAALPWEEFRNMTLLMIAYLVPPAGKESVIPAGIALGLPVWVVVPSIAILDILAGLFIALNFDLALKIPLLGRWIENFLRCGQQFLSERKWLERLYFIGIVIFVMFPLQGSGGIGGSIVGRMLGMSRLEVFTAITVGAFLGCILIAIASASLRFLFEQSAIIGLSVVAIAIILVLIIYSRRRCGILNCER